MHFNRPLRSFVHLLGLALFLSSPALLWACEAGDTAGEPITTPPVDPSTASRICDGSAGTSFVVRHRWGNAPSVPAPGDAMFAQNGAALLTIDGNCNYIAYDDERNVRTGAIAHAEIVQLESDLELSSWQEGGPEWGGLACDEPEVDYRFKGDSFEQTSGCNGGSSLSGTFDPAKVDQESRTWIKRLVNEGTAVDGSVRVIVYEPNDPSRGTAAPKPWPLASTQPSAIAVTEEMAIDAAGTVFSPADSALLRPLVAGAGALGQPVTDARGHVYLVLTRDVLPGEE